MTGWYAGFQEICVVPNAALFSFLALAWRVAGYWGLDHWALTWLGVPGEAGTAFQRRRVDRGQSPA